MKKTPVSISMVCAAILAVVILWAAYFNGAGQVPEEIVSGPVTAGPLRIAVMDPLARENACACVGGYAQRDYHALAGYLKTALGREVVLCFCVSMQSATQQFGQLPDMLIGKQSVLEFDGRKNSVVLKPIAMLTGQDGATTFTGLVVVPSSSGIDQVSGLKGLRVGLGPPDSDEKHAAALALFRRHGLEFPADLPVYKSCTVAAMGVIAGEVDGVVISSYAMPLLIGCDTVGRDELKTIGVTEAVPFIAVYTTPRVDASAASVVQQALFDLCQHPTLLKQLESRHGFVRPGANGAELTGWTDWGGRGRRNRSAWLPGKLPATPPVLWRQNLESQSLGGIAATAGQVVVSDKSSDLSQDIWRCLSAETGAEQWQVAYPAPGEMDYTNAPRATPAIAGGRVYLLGAFGDLHCVDMASGEIVWRCNLIDRFGGEVPTWGFCATPLVIDGRVIVPTAALDAALIALDGASGELVWKTAGNPPGYGNFIAAVYSGTRQIIGHDATTLGGWDIDRGVRLWSVTPPLENDFNVPTPLQLGNHLLVATENNGARLYAFHPDGTIVPEPVAVNANLTPDIATPVLAGGAVWGIGGCGLFCLDPADHLRTLWSTDRAPYNDFANLIAGETHVLAILSNGALALLPALPPADYQPDTPLTMFSRADGMDSEVWSQAALVENRLYLRSEDRIVCCLLPGRDE